MAWMSVKATAQYIDGSDKTVRRWFKQGLPYVRMPSGTLRTHSDWVDTYMEQYTVKVGELNAAVDEILTDLGLG